jgi:hypothetical protein
MTTASASAIDAAPQPAVPFRRVLVLCLPALILALVLRVSLLVAVPEVYYGPDSNSYFDTASHFWSDGTLQLKVKRRYLYPIVLTFAPLLPGSTVAGVAVVQHILGLGIILGIGWIVAQMTRYHNLWVPLTTCLAAVWPRMLWYEHEMIAEVWMLAAFVAAVAFALPCGALKDKQRLFWFLVAVAALVACKPHGRALWAGLMVVAVLTAGNPLKWGIKNLAMVALAGLIMITSGSGRQAGWLLLNTALPFVNTEGEPYAEYRTILRPFVEEARADLPNYAENQQKYKKGLSGKRPMMGSGWIELSNNKELYSKVVKSLAVEAILSHPFEYAQLVVRKIARVGSASNRGAFAPKQFWSLQQARLPKSMADTKLLYGVDGDALARMVEERSTRTTWIAPWMNSLSHALTWTTYSRRGTGESPEIRFTILGWLLALGLVACLSPRYFVCRAFLWLPLACYLFATFGVGDALGRYLHPVDWVGLVIIAIGLDSVATLLAEAVTRMRRGAGSADPPTSDAAETVSLDTLLPCVAGEARV